MIWIFLTFTFFSMFFVSTWFLVRAVKNSLQLIEKLDEIQEQIDESILALNEKHKRLDSKSKTEIFFDDPIIKDVVKDIAESRDLIIKIAENFNDNRSQN